MSEVLPPFAKLDLPSPEEYRQRKVALISGETLSLFLNERQV